MNLSTVNDTSTSPPISLIDPGVQGVHVISYIPMLTASYALTIILGLPTNVYILWLILTGAGGTMASEFFSLNLTVSEVLLCLSNAFRIADQYVQSDLVHKAAAFSIGFIFSGRPLFQCCICLERYLVVLGSCCLFVFENLTPVSFYSVLFQSLIYFLLMSFCCLSVLWALKRPGPGDGDREGTNSIKMKAFKIILIILVYAAVSQLPLVLVISIKSYIPYVDFSSGLSFSFCIVIISGFVQPLLYLHRVGKLPCIKCL